MSTIISEEAKEHSVVLPPHLDLNVPLKPSVAPDSKPVEKEYIIGIVDAMARKVDEALMNPVEEEKKDA